jgi:hypothetical protein
MLHGEPEYRRRARQEAEQNQRYADREWDEAAQKRAQKEIITSFKGIEEKLDRAIDEKTAKNQGERRRHLAEIFGLWVAAFVGVAAIVQSCRDSSDQRNVTERQLNEMQTQSITQRAEVKGVLRLDLDTPTGPGGWDITTTWVNIGKSDALNVRGWKDTAVIPLVQDRAVNAATIEHYDFITAPPRVQLPSDGSTVLAGDHIMFISQKITLQQGIDTIAGKVILVSYGYIEYFDIFGTFYTVRFCRLFNFYTDGSTVTVTRPVILPLSCEKRTEKPKSDK